MKLPAFDYHRPDSLEEAIRLLQMPDARALAGGQSLLPIMAFRLASPSALIDLGRVPGLDRIEVNDDVARLGAMVRWCDIECDEALQKAVPILPSTMEHVAHYQIRTRGTIGGSLAHADPAAEFPGLAVTCDARVIVRGPKGVRTIQAADFITGALETSLESGELITHVEFPVWPANRRWAFLEFSRRRGDFALAGVAVFYDLGLGERAENVHVGVIGATDRARRLAGAEMALSGQIVDAQSIAAAVAAARNEVDPPGDIHASAEYRRAILGTLLERALIKASK